jgi:fatty acid CoA ligase FadD9
MLTDALTFRTGDSRVAELAATDPQFAAAMPSPAVTAAASAPGLRLPEVIDTILAGYAARPALGQRRVEFVQDPATGKTTGRLLPEFETISYRDLAEQSSALTRAWANGWVKPGDRVATIGFTSVDYTFIDLALIRLGAVAVPLQSTASAGQLQPIVAETAPTLIASSITCLAEAVDLALGSTAVRRLVVFDFHPEVDDERDLLAAGGARLSAAGSQVVLATLADEIRIGAALTETPPELPAGDPLALLIYTSGSTGAPKGARYLESGVAAGWLSTDAHWDDLHGRYPIVTLSFMPMSHVMGRQSLHSALSLGGTVYFAASADLSTFLTDLALVRPTQLVLVPRVWEMIFQEAQRNDVGSSSLGVDRCITAVTGSAPISPELKDRVEKLLGIHLADIYGSTEAGIVIVDGSVRRPPVLDYRLVDVPELGYFTTDMPHPRGELLVKTSKGFPGYFQRAEVTASVFDEDGYYRTGDIFAETTPDHLEYVDRRNNVLKLSQGEFVTLAKLETALGESPLVRQIFPYGKSTEPYLLAVIVPTVEALEQYRLEELQTLIAQSLQETAAATGLQPYEIPRDFIIETTPFSAENGLLTGIRKLAWPQLKARYSAALDQLYAEIAANQADHLRELRQHGAEAPVLETVTRAAGAMLGNTGTDPLPTAHFTDLGGDSLSALTFANLLTDIYAVDVPVGVIVSPANDLRTIAAYVEALLAGHQRPTFASVHGAEATVVHAADLTLNKFVDAATLSTAPNLPGPAREIRTVLLTGATGFLGRYLTLEWLERMSLVDGKVICLVRARDDQEARQRLDATFDSGDPKLLAHYRDMASGHLEVIAGDKADEGLGVDPQTWQRLADTVDLIVDPAALVNHVLPYSQLFGPNVLGTAELIRIAITTRLKPYLYVSTIAVGAGIPPGRFAEEPDIRSISASRAVDSSYANGYANSKWAGEVLLRAAHELCGLPVSVFRCDMILADTTYAGQLNVADMFTRLMLSVAATGLAPASFYELDGAGNRRRAHYDGLPVEFVAESISTIGSLTDGFETYHVMNPYDDGLGLDEFIDWIVEAGYPIHRVNDYADWLNRFETAMRTLPEHQRQYSLLPLLHNYQQPEHPVCGSIAPTEHFRTAVQEAKIGPAKEIPHISRDVIRKYLSDLTLLGLLEP